MTNARVVLADRVIENGWVAGRTGALSRSAKGDAPERGEDLAGDLLLPGLVELHTDHIEAHYVPRPKVYWDPVAAVVSYDGQLATCGITTVLDSLRVWREEGAEEVDGEAEILADAITTARDAELLRIEHFLHLRCEVPMPNVVEETTELIGRPDVRLLSLMDHTPGQRQFRDERKLRDYYRGKKGGMTDAELDVLFERRLDYQAAHAEANHRGIVELARSHNTPLASHDDTTSDHVAEAIRDGVAIAEFPTTVEAAQALHAAGVRVLMGAPNLVRGGSHAGNVATAELARAGALDILSSDYVPASLLMAALRLPKAVPGIGLADGDAHGDEDSGRSGRIDGSRRDRGRQARRSHPRAHGGRRTGGSQRMARWSAGGMSLIATVLGMLRRSDLIGPGRLVLVVGPSGAGKDTLIAGARAACRDDATVVFPRRVVTRPASNFEDNDFVSKSAFEQAAAKGAFAFWWSAHGHDYGIPLAIDFDIESGRTVVCNVSRTMVDVVRKRYAHVMTILVTAPKDVLAARLAARDRASDGRILERLSRNDIVGEYVPAGCGHQQCR